MKVCIIGAGVVGTYLAKKLSRDKYEIAVIDVDSDKLNYISYNCDVLTINCNALNVNCLKKLEDFDLFVVVTESEEKNVAIATLLKALFKKEKIIVRVGNKAFSSPPVKELLGYEAVNILSETVQNIIYHVKYPFVKEIVKLEKEDLIIFSYQLNVEDTLSGKQIAELKSVRDKIDFTVVAIEREDKVIIPKGKNFLYPKDKIYVAVKEEQLVELAKLLGISYSPVKLVFVFGYSKFTEELLIKLSDFPELKVKFFSPDKKICENLSGEFPNVSIFHGELTDMDLLKEEGIEKSDFSITTTEDEETNILTSILAKKLGCKKVAALIMHPEYESIIESIGIDVPLVPRKILASKVYTMLSSRSILEFLEISEKLDVYERTVPKEFVGKKVSEVGSKLCGIIVAVKKEGKLEVVKGDTILNSEDTVICAESKDEV